MVDRYLVERRAAGYVNYRSGKAMLPLVTYLDELGVLSRGAVRLGPVPALLERYRSYLISERGLTSGTARCYLLSADAHRGRDLPEGLVHRAAIQGRAHA